MKTLYKGANYMDKDELYEKKEILYRKIYKLEEYKSEINKVFDMHEEMILNDISHYERRLNEASGKISVELMGELLQKTRERKVSNEDAREKSISEIERIYQETEEEIRSIDEAIGEKYDE